MDGWPLATIFTRFRGVLRSVTALGCDCLGALHLRGARGIVLQSLTPFLTVDHPLGNSVGAIE